MITISYGSKVKSLIQHLLSYSNFIKKIVIFIIILIKETIIAQYISMGEYSNGRLAPLVERYALGNEL